MHNTEDKNWWVGYGLEREHDFVENIAPKAHLVAMINPEKKQNRYAPDLLIDTDEKIADLKTQETPFFTAGRHRGYDPTYTVTFNKKDYDRYKSLYPTISLIFWVNWGITEMTLGQRTIKTSKIHGVWRCTLTDITEFITIDHAPLHSYQRRTDDEVNARDSYLLDLRKMTQVWVE